MILYLHNKLMVEDYTSEVLVWCERNLTFANPDYEKKEAMGLWLGNTPKRIIMYEIAGNRLFMPFGVLPKFYKEFKDNLSLIKTCYKPLRERKYQSLINTYDYQETAIQKAINGRNGIIVAPCGSGKTQMGLELIARIGGKALWVTHTQDLLTQSMNRAKSVYGIPSSEIGSITAGKVNIGNTITFATVQTLVGIDLRQYATEWDVIVADECHHLVGSPTQVQMFYKVFSNLSARYKYGLTATPYRTDGLEGCMFSVIGDILHEVPKSAVEDKTCEVRVDFVETFYEPDIDGITAGDGTLIYSALISDIVRDENRNEFIASIVKKTDGTMIVLSDRVEHLKELMRLCKDKKSALIDGSMQSKSAKEKRKKVLDALGTGEVDVVFATYKLAKEGLDVPSLKNVLFATPCKDKTTVIQSAGRVGRKAVGKDYGCVIDLVDNFGLLMGYYRKRKRYYTDLGYVIL